MTIQRLSLAYLLVIALCLSQTKAFAKGDQRRDPKLAAAADFWESYAPETPSHNPSAFEITDKIKVEDIVEAPQDYTYAAFDKPNPFDLPPLSSYLSKMEVPITSVLQKYRVDKLIAAGIWLLSNKERKALITTPASEGVVVSVGDFVGNRGGRVTSINAARVLVREFTLTPDGNRLFDDTELWLGGEAPKQQEFIILPSRRMHSRGEAHAGKGYLETTPLQKSRDEKIFRKARESLEGSLKDDAGTETNGGSALPDSINLSTETPYEKHSATKVKAADHADKGEVNVNNPAHPTADAL